jgi:pimeloyl-ACP methyl ester carboxylesterase
MKNIKKLVMLFLVIASSTALFAQKSTIKKLNLENIDGSNFQHYSVKTNGITMHYTELGQGEKVVLLIHGWPEDWKEWVKVMPQLAKKFRVIAVDLRGAGQSEKTETGYDKLNLAKDLNEFITNLELKNVYLMGHDIGGMTTYTYANTYASSIKAFGVFDVPLPGIEPTWSYVTSDQRAWHFMFHTEKVVPETLVKGNESFYFKHFINSMQFNKNAFSDKDFEHIINNMKDPGNLKGGFEYYRAFGQDAKNNKLFTVKIEIPVLALGGQYSMGENQANLMKSLANNVTGGVIPNSGHWIAQENMAATAKFIEDFVINN